MLQPLNQELYGVSDKLLGIILPIVVYWVYSGLYCMLGGMENYRLHTTKDKNEKNLIIKKEVVKGVLLQQVVQAVVATVLFAVRNPITPLLQSFCFYAIFLFDFFHFLRLRYGDCCILVF